MPFTIRRSQLLASLAAAVLAAGLGIALILPGGSHAAGATVSVFPIAGDPVASPSTQITFRGIPIGQLGQVTVTGSKSGVHSGRVAADSDGRGGSFIPSQPFTPGEQVTVSTSQNIVGGTNGSYSFGVATPAGRVPQSAPQRSPRVKGDVYRYVSQPGLQPAAVHITRLPRHAQPGDVFVAPQTGPVQYGPMILGPWGGLVWFHPVPKNSSATDFRVQSYHDKPVLTWWQGNVSGAGTGQGEDEIYDTSYRHVATVRAGNGLLADLHEFSITPFNTAVITSFYPVVWDARSVKGGSSRQIVLDSVVQEIDIPTGLVLFQWDSLSQVPVADSYSPIPHPSSHPYDYFHINSIQLDAAGNFIVSSRATWTVYDIDGRTGHVVWRLNGKHSSFKMGHGTQFAFQHDARLRAGNQMTIFDDGAGPPPVEKLSRALTLQLDTKHMTASLVHSFTHRGLLAFYEGNVQELGGGDEFVGWGQQPYFTEFNRRGQIVFDGRFVDTNSNYRAYRFRWTGTPTYRPSIVARNGRVYLSWNGATELQRWRLLTGSSSGSLKTLEVVHKQAFESSYRLPKGTRYVAAQAVDSHGHTIGNSATVPVR